MLRGKAGLLVPVILLAVALALVLAGCGSSGPVSSNTAPSKPATTPDGLPMSSIITGYAKLSADDVVAAQEALRCATDANCGSRFKATEVRCKDSWSRIAVQEIDVPLDEAVGFNVYLKRATSGKWEVVQTGTDLTIDDLPGAPPEIFQ
jgi:hypothetical protein